MKMTVRYDIIYRKLFTSLLIDRTTKMVNINAKCIVRWVKVAVLYCSSCVSVTLTKRVGDQSCKFISLIKHVTRLDVLEEMKNLR